MVSYTDAELVGLMRDLESDRVERKRSPSDTRKISEAICALANDLAGSGRPGVVLVGVEDDGSCSGLAVTDDILKTLAGLRDDGRILPLPSVDVEPRQIDGCSIAVVTVHASSAPPVRFRNRAYVRVGPTTRLATSADEQRLSERRRAADLPFDHRALQSAAVADLDEEHIRAQYLPRAIAEDVLEENERDFPTQLKSLRFVMGDCPTNGALIAFGQNPLQWHPGAYVQFVRFDGLEATDPIISSHRLWGRVDDVLAETDKLLQLNVATAVDIAAGAREQRHADYPISALRQLAYNAVMHRSYEDSNSPTRIYWFKDRVVIESPGGLHGDLTVDDLNSGITGYRNPLVAEIMCNLGFAQSFGVGIPTARKALNENGNPALELQAEPRRFIATVMRAQ